MATKKGNRTLSQLKPEYISWQRCSSPDISLGELYNSKYNHDWSYTNSFYPRGPSQGEIRTKDTSVFRDFMFKGQNIPAEGEKEAFAKDELYYDASASNDPSNVRPICNALYFKGPRDTYGSQIYAGTHCYKNTTIPKMLNQCGIWSVSFCFSLEDGYINSPPATLNATLKTYTIGLFQLGPIEIRILPEGKYWPGTKTFQTTQTPQKMNTCFVLFYIDNILQKKMAYKWQGMGNFGFVSIVINNSKTYGLTIECTGDYLYKLVQQEPDIVNNIQTYDNNIKLVSQDKASGEICSTYYRSSIKNILYFGGCSDYGSNNKCFNGGTLDNFVAAKFTKYVTKSRKSEANPSYCKIDSNGNIYGTCKNIPIHDKDGNPNGTKDFDYSYKPITFESWQMQDPDDHPFLIFDYKLEEPPETEDIDTTTTTTETTTETEDTTTTTTETTSKETTTTTETTSDPPPTDPTFPVTVPTAETYEPYTIETIRRDEVYGAPNFYRADISRHDKIIDALDIVRMKKFNRRDFVFEWEHDHMQRSNFENK